ncbi:MAG TPA: carboxypeptidase regulatory-like domain-containing protein [Vicinamibacterales bacterium]|nr:carboxypeptidase regulatory-like domain-containing protein [Vicinamibacterales bacterium]
MTSPNLVRRVTLLCALFAMPAIAHAQEAAITGTITDATGAVLPGVTVTAVLEATGNTFTAVTDVRGVYRIAGRVGVYRLRAELAGFKAVTRENLQLLVGQVMTVNLPMLEATAAETVTVTAETPLLSTATSNLGGNVDPTQVQELPVNGRNWIALSLLAPGSRTSSTAAIAPLPDRNGGEAREFQLNLDGQQISSELGAGNQPRFSQDSIAEFQFISNRFDATQGRSTGVQVNAITKSGSNRLSGLFRTNFRDSSMNAENPVLGRVVPITNQQYSTAVGGPVVVDKLHYFANFEYERNPLTSIWNTPYPAFNIELQGTTTRKMGGLRLDYQLSPKTRVMGKFSKHKTYEPFGPGASTSHPAQTGTNDERNEEYIGQFTQVLSNRALNEVKGGYSHFGFANELLTDWSKHWQAPRVTNGHPRITLTGFSIAGNANYPRHRDQKVSFVRDDFSVSFDARGRHDLKAGGEFVRHFEDSENCNNCGGAITANNGIIPPDVLQAIFPDPFDVDTWNLAALSPYTRTYTIGIGEFPLSYGQPKFATWLQDDWRIGDRLTLNLGMRYDASFNSWANDVGVPPFYSSGRPNDINNLQPRIGFAYAWNDKTVIRGGSGLYFADALTVDAFWPYYNAQIARIQFNNDGRADFASNPLNGQPLPTFEQAQTLFCNSPAQAANFAAWQARNFAAPQPCLLNAYQEIPAPSDYMRQARTWQTSIGVQRQIGRAMAVEADYVYSQGRNEKDTIDNVNLTYDEATGANLPYTNRATLPYPQYGIISMIPHNTRSGYHGLQTNLTKRMSQRWQASATYTLSFFKDAQNQPFSGLVLVPFAVAPDLGNEYSYADTDQRHRAVLSGIWEVGRGFQVSGMHYLGAGIRSATNYGGDVRNVGAGGSARLRPASLGGTIVPRNDFIQPAQNRTDVRVQQRIPLGGRRSIDLMAEAFNVFNRPNWGITTQESSANFGQRTSAQYREVQLGFRLTF